MNVESCVGDAGWRAVGPASSSRCQAFLWYSWALTARGWRQHQHTAVWSWRTHRGSARPRRHAAAQVCSMLSLSSIHICLFISGRSAFADSVTSWKWCCISAVMVVLSVCFNGTCHFRVRVMSDRLSGLSSVLQTNIRPRVGYQMTSISVTARPGVGGVPATTVPQAIQLVRNVQTALDWVLNKQVSCCRWLMFVIFFLF